MEEKKSLFLWSDKTYDTVKYISINIIPALEFLWCLLATTWKIPYGLEVGTSIGGLGMFLALCIGMSKREYEKAKAEHMDSAEG